MPFQAFSGFAGNLLGVAQQGSQTARGFAKIFGGRRRKKRFRPGPEPPMPAATSGGAGVGGLVERGLELVKGGVPIFGRGGLVTMPGRTKLGKLSGQPIPRGFEERMSPQGQIFLVKHRRRRGITATELRGAFKVATLVNRITVGRRAIFHRPRARRRV